MGLGFIRTLTVTRHGLNGPWERWMWLSIEPISETHLGFLKTSGQTQRLSFSKPLQELWLLKTSLKQGLVWALEESPSLEFRIWQAAAKLLKDDSLVGIYLMIIKTDSTMKYNQYLKIFCSKARPSEALLLVSLPPCCGYWKETTQEGSFI